VEKHVHNHFAQLPYDNFYELPKYWAHIIYCNFNILALRKQSSREKPGPQDNLTNILKDIAG